MNVIAIGMDLIECERIRDMLRDHADRFTERMLTDAELEYCQRYTADMAQRVAGRFAAKEAILKVLGTGWRGQIAWRDMEILNNSAGKPEVTLTGECERIAQSLRIANILVTITHTKNYAAATAIGVGF